MMLANDLKTYYDEVRRYLDCPKDEQDRLLLSVNKQVIELQVDNPNLDYDGIVEFLGEPESLAASLIECLSPDVIQVYHKKKKRKHARFENESFNKKAFFICTCGSFCCVSYSCSPSRCYRYC